MFEESIAMNDRTHVACVEKLSLRKMSSTTTRFTKRNHSSATDVIRNLVKRYGTQMVDIYGDLHFKMMGLLISLRTSLMNIPKCTSQWELNMNIPANVPSSSTQCASNWWWCQGKSQCHNNLIKTSEDKG